MCGTCQIESDEALLRDYASEPSSLALPWAFPVHSERRFFVQRSRRHPRSVVGRVGAIAFAIVIAPLPGPSEASAQDGLPQALELGPSARGQRPAPEVELDSALFVPHIVPAVVGSSVGGVLGLLFGIAACQSGCGGREDPGLALGMVLGFAGGTLGSALGACRGSGAEPCVAQATAYAAVGGLAGVGLAAALSKYAGFGAGGLAPFLLFSVTQAGVTVGLLR